jgi:hypothetical protein
MTVPGPALLGLAGTKIARNRITASKLRIEAAGVLIKPPRIRHIFCVSQGYEEADSVLICTHKPLEALAGLPDAPEVVRPGGVALHTAHVINTVLYIAVIIIVTVLEANIRAQDLARLSIYSLARQNANLAAARNHRRETALNPGTGADLPDIAAIIAGVPIPRSEERRFFMNIRLYAEFSTRPFLDGLPLAFTTYKRDFGIRNGPGGYITMSVITRKDFFIRAEYIAYGIMYRIVRHLKPLQHLIYIDRYKNIPGLDNVRRMAEKRANDRNGGDKGNGRDNGGRILVSAKYMVLAKRQKAAPGYPMLVISGMLITVLQAVQTKSKPEVVQLVRVANNAVGGHVRKSQALTGTAPKDRER